MSLSLALALPHAHALAACVGAILVNPWDTSGMASALAGAVELGDGERRVAHDNMLQYVSHFTSEGWSKVRGRAARLGAGRGGAGRGGATG